jgi:hypothetical protein
VPPRPAGRRRDPRLNWGLLAAFDPGLAGPVPPDLAREWQVAERSLGLVAAVVIGTVVVVAVLTAVPARIGARRPVAGVLQAE